MELVTRDNHEEVISALPCVVSLSAAEAEKAQVRAGFVALVYADCVWWTSVWEHEEQQHGPRDCFTSLGTIDEERHFFVSFFLLTRTRSVIPPAYSSWQTEYSTVFNVIRFC